MVLVLIAVTASQLFAPEANKAEAQGSPLVGKRLVGYAWSANVGWISFNEASTAVTIDSDLALKGFAWSPSIGWIKFGGLDRRTSSFLGLTGDAKVYGQSGAAGFLGGYARACNGMPSSSVASCDAKDFLDASLVSENGGWDGLIQLGKVTGTSNHPYSGGTYGITIASDGTTLIGQGGRGKPFAWGGDIFGWISFENVSVRSQSEFCVIPTTEGGIVMVGQTKASVSRTGDTCSESVWSCPVGGQPAVQVGASTEVDCSDDDDDDDFAVPFNCTHAGSFVGGGEEVTLFSRSQVRAEQSCSDYSATLRCERVANDNPVGQMEIIAPNAHLGDEAQNYKYQGCRAFPSYIEQ